MPGPQDQGDLSRTITHESDESWPTMIEVVAYWSRGQGRRGRRRSITVSADQFFGRNGHGAPISGDQLLGMVQQLRRNGPK